MSDKRKALLLFGAVVPSLLGSPGLATSGYLTCVLILKDGPGWSWRDGQLQGSQIQWSLILGAGNSKQNSQEHQNQQRAQDTDPSTNCPILHARTCVSRGTGSCLDTTEWQKVASATPSGVTTCLLTRIWSDLACFISDAPTDVLAGKGFFWPAQGKQGSHGELNEHFHRKKLHGTKTPGSVGATQVMSSLKGVDVLWSPWKCAHWCSLHVPVVWMVLQILPSTSFCSSQGVKCPPSPQQMKSCFQKEFQSDKGFYTFTGLWDGQVKQWLDFQKYGAAWCWKGDAYYTSGCERIRKTRNRSTSWLRSRIMAERPTPQKLLGMLRCLQWWFQSTEVDDMPASLIMTNVAPKLAMAA